MFFLTLLLYATAIWQFFQVFLLMPVSASAISLIGYALCGLQALAANRIRNLTRSGAVLAVVVLCFRFAALGLQSLLALVGGADLLTLAGMVFSLVLGLVIAGLLAVSWNRMQR